MRPAVFLLIFLLAAGNTSGQSSIGLSRDALQIYWRLAKSNDFWSPSVFTICGGILGLLVMAFEGKNTLLRRSKSITNSIPTAIFSHTVEIYGSPDITQTLHVTPLYVRRMMQCMTKRYVTQVSKSSPVTLPVLPVDEKENSEMWRKRDENIRKKKRERRSQGPRINPDVLREINNTWQLTYGFECGDIIFIENELDNTVSKVPLVNSTKKSKSVKFDNSVKIVYIEKENSGRRLKCWKEARKIVNNIVCDRNPDGQTIV